MFGSKNKNVPASPPVVKTTKIKTEKKSTGSEIHTKIGRGTVIEGDIRFSGGLHVEGVIKGNIHGEGDNTILVLTEDGLIQGEVRIPCMVLNGQIEGDVFAEGKLELYQHSRITGDVYYHLLDMKAGAEVNGKLVRQKDQLKSKSLSYDATETTTKINNK